MRIATVFAAATLVVAMPAQAQGGRFNAIWGAGPNDIWAVGEQGLAAHFNGSGWVNSRTGASATLRAVWASGPNDVWAVGEGATILRMTGRGWTWVRALVPRDFIAVGGCGPNDVWILGQADESGRPAVFLHFDGSNWTKENAPMAFRAAGMTFNCVTVSGSGGPGITSVGTAYWDPRPDQRRSAGVLLRRSGGAWTSTGFDGRSVTDPQIGGTGWTGITVGGGATLLSGMNGDGSIALLLGRGNAWTSIPAPTAPEQEAEDFRFSLSGDGTPLTVFGDGYGRYVSGAWAITSAKAMSSGNFGMSAADQSRYAQLAQQLSAAAQGGRQLSQQQITEFQQLQQRIMGAQQNIVTASQRMQGLGFGRDAYIWAPSATHIWVATQNNNINHVTGDSSAVAWSTHCGLVPQYATLEPCAGNTARGAAVPSPAPGAQPVAGDEEPVAEQQQQQQPNRPGLPNLPSIRRPRIPRP